MLSPLSHRPTVFVSHPTFSARSACDQPLSSRSRFKRKLGIGLSWTSGFFMALDILSTLLLSTPGLSNARQLPSAKAAPPQKMGECAVSGGARHGTLPKKGVGPHREHWKALCLPLDLR